MLNALRQGGFTKGLMGAVVVLIIAAFALDYRTSGVNDADSCVAEMDGECVELADYQVLLRLVAPSGATNKQLRELGFVQYAVDALIERKLLLQEAERLGVSASNEDLDARLALGQVHFSWPAEAPIPQALAAGRGFPRTGAAPTITYLRVRSSDTEQFDYEIYKRQIMNKLRMTPKGFKTYQELELVAARVRDLVTNPVRVSETEVLNQYVREKSNATARVVEAKLEWFQRFGASATDAEVDAFMASKAALLDEGWTGEEKKWQADCPVVSEVLIAYPPGADDAAKQEVAGIADTVLGLLKKKADFAVVAKVYSESASAQVGGMMGCLTADYGPSGADLVKAVEGLQPGALSDVLESPQGLHIFLSHGKLDAEKAKAMGRRALARRLVEEDLAKQRADAYAKKLIAAAKGGAELETAAVELAKNAFGLAVDGEERNALLAVAVEHELAPRMEVSRTFTLMGSPVYGVKGEVDVAELVFALEKADDTLEAPVETHQSFAVVQLKEKTEATKEEFDSEKPELMRAAREMRRSEALVSYLARLRAQIKELKLNPKHTGAEQDGEESDSPAESG